MSSLLSQLSECLSSVHAQVRFDAKRVVPSTLNDELYRALLVGLAVIEGGRVDADSYFVSDSWLRLAQFVALHPELYARVAAAKAKMTLWFPRGFLSDDTFTSTIDYLCGGSLLDREADGYRTSKASGLVALATKAAEDGLFLNERRVLQDLVALRLSKKLIELR